MKSVESKPIEAKFTPLVFAFDLDGCLQSINASARKFLSDDETDNRLRQDARNALIARLLDGISFGLDQWSTDAEAASALEPFVLRLNSQRFRRQVEFAYDLSGDPNGVIVTLLPVVEQTEKRLRSVIDHMLGFVGEMDADGTLLDANRTALQVVHLQRHEVVGKPFWQTYWWNYDPEVAMQLKRAIGRAANGETVRYDACVRTSSSERMWIDFMLNPVFDERGNVIRIIPSGVDVTDRTRVKRNYERRSAFARGLFQGNPDCLMLLDTDGHLMEINENGSRLMEIRNTRAYIGKPWTSIWTHSSVPAEALETARQGGTAHFQAFGPTEQGTPKYWDVIVVRVASPDTDQDALLAVARDITIQHANQLAVRKSEHRLQEMADAMPQLVWTADQYGNVDYYNSRVGLYSGLKRRADGSWSWPKTVHPDDREATVRAFTNAVQAKQGYQIEHRICMADGSYRWHLSRALPLHEETGELRWIGTATDIHDVKAAAQSIRDSRERLSNALNAAEAASRSRGEFLANMSHEIRTPMSAILGYADLLKEHLSDPDDLQCVETIRCNGEFLLEIINDILDLSKIDAGKLLIDARPVRPQVVLSEVLSLMQVLAVEKGIRLSLEIKGKLPEFIETDCKRLRQILVNLVGNAIKFTDKGEVRIVARLRPRCEELRFEIVDTGIGISESDQEKLFQPFTQGDASSTRPVGGTGLGLTISRRLATLLGGDLTVRSELTQGSTFSLTIDTGSLDGVKLVAPQTSTSLPSQRKPPQDLTQSPRLQGRILIVDDRREIRFLAQHLLEEAGCQIETANDGKEAFDRVRLHHGTTDQYDAIILDMQMPVMDGYNAATAIRREGITTPIIALTANAMKGDREKCLSAGCTDFTTKPLDKRVLLQMVAKHLQPSSVATTQSEPGG